MECTHTICTAYINCTPIYNLFPPSFCVLNLSVPAQTSPEASSMSALCTGKPSIVFVSHTRRSKKHASVMNHSREGCGRVGIIPFGTRWPPCSPRTGRRPAPVGAPPLQLAGQPSCPWLFSDLPVPWSEMHWPARAIKSTYFQQLPAKLF